MKLTKNGLFIVAEFSPTNISTYQYQNVSYSFLGVNSVSINIFSNSDFVSNIFTGLLSELTDENDTPYTQISLNAFFASFAAGNQIADNTIEVNSLLDLPAPVGGVITLPNLGQLYKINNEIDLLGNTLVVNSNVLLGFSQDTTGFANGVMTINSTCALRYIKLLTIDMTIDALGGAFDWPFVNFYGCPYVKVVNASNLIIETTGFIESMGINLTGTVDSIVISPNCIFRAADISEAIPTPIGYNTTNFVNIASAAVITRRCRIQDSVFSTSQAPQTGINVELGASIQVESLILKTVRFTGAGTALVGINGSDDRASFFEVFGGNSINSARIGSMVMKDNNIATVVSVQNDRYKVAGTFEVGTVMQRFAFDAVNNALEYTSVVPAVFVIQAPFTARNDAGANVVIGSYLGVKKAANPTFNPDIDRIDQSEQYITTRNDNSPNSGTCQAAVLLEQGDKIYFITENRSGEQNIVHEFVNVIAQRAAI